MSSCCLLCRESHSFLSQELGVGCEFLISVYAPQTHFRAAFIERGNSIRVRALIPRTRPSVHPPARLFVCLCLANGGGIFVNYGQRHYFRYYRSYPFPLANEIFHNYDILYFRSFI